MSYDDQRELTTADDVPISELLDYGVQLIETYNEADRGFLDALSTEVSSRIFRTQQGSMKWEELGEMEHPRTGDISSNEMAFSASKFGRSLGFSREFIEDNPSEMVRDRFRKLVDGAREREFEVMFSVMENGIADGTDLVWYDVEDYGSYSFAQDHDHTFADTEELFGDTNSHTPLEHIRAANLELRHHGKTPDVGVLGNDLATEFVDGLTDNPNYHIPAAEGLRETAIPDVDYRPGGVTLVQTPYIDGNTMYVFDSSDLPIKMNRVRPVELTDNTGNPIGGSGGSRGDPGALLGAYGSARYGAKMTDPLSGVKFTADDLTTA